MARIHTPVSEFKPGTKVRVRYYDISGHIRWSGVREVLAVMNQKTYPGGRMIDKPVSDCSYWNVLDFKRA